MADRNVTPPSWTLASALITQGIAAIIVPSFAPSATPADRNVVFWHWSDELPARVILIDDEGRIPKNPATWA